jgi:DivIVA domain-containing protein
VRIKVHEQYMTDFDMRPGGADPRRVERLAARAERTFSGDDNLTSDALLKELAGIIANPVVLGYDPQQVVEAAEEWAKRLENTPIFDVVLRGYSREQVKALRERVEEGVATAEEVREASFHVVLRGYNRDQVHTALEKWAQRLDEDAVET